MLLPGKLFRTIVVLLLVIGLSACGQSPYRQAVDGLTETRDTREFDHIYLLSDQAIPTFNRVFIEPVAVSFSDHWLRTFRTQYTQRDLDRLTEQYAGLLDKSMRNALDGSYQLVDSPAEAEIIFRPKLEALNIYAPDLSNQGVTRHYIHEAGNATLDLLLLDAASQKPLAQFVDHRETFSNPGGRMERTDRITNARYFSRMMDRWSDNLVRYLRNQDSVE